MISSVRKAKRRVHHLDGPTRGSIAAAGTLACRKLAQGIRDSSKQIGSDGCTI